MEKKIISEVFRKSDIRGFVDNQITEEFSYFLGVSMVKTLKTKNIVVGRDNRNSSKKLENFFIKGVVDCGVNVYKINSTLSPIAYFVCQVYSFPGVFITASHNPKEYNGFKLIGRDGLTIGKNIGLDKIKKEFEKIYFKKKGVFKKAKTNGKIFSHNFFKKYKKNILSFKEKLSFFKIVINNGGNDSVKMLKEIFKKEKITIINITPKKGSISNPLVDDGFEVSKEIISKKADFGVFFDFDGDRVFFFDEKGRKIHNSIFSCLLIEYFLKKYPNAKVLFDVRSDWIVKETIKKNNGKAIMIGVGHATVKQKMKKFDAIYCGEISGHNYFKENKYSESSFIPIILLMNILSKEKKPLSKLIKKFQKNKILNETNFRVKKPDEKIKKIDTFFNYGKKSKIDGIRIDFKDWWFSVRKSKNEPILRLNMGAVNKKLLIYKKKIIQKVILE